MAAPKSTVPDLPKVPVKYVIQCKPSPYFWVVMVIPEKWRKHPLFLSENGKFKTRLKECLHTGCPRTAAQRSKPVVARFQNYLAKARETYSRELHQGARFAGRMKAAKSRTERAVIWSEWEAWRNDFLGFAPSPGADAFEKFQHHEKVAELDQYADHLLKLDYKYPLGGTDMQMPPPSKGIG